MKYKTIIIPMIVLATISSIYADEVKITPTPSVATQITSIQDIDRKIKETLEYIENLPQELDQTKLELQQILEKTEENKAKVIRLVKYTDVCFTKSFKDGSRGKSMCETIMNAKFNNKNFDEILKEKSAKLLSVKKYVESEIKRVSSEMKDIPALTGGVEILRDMKKVLTDI